jgi:hypothetical protein
MGRFLFPNSSTKTPKGLLKTQTQNPYGVISETPNPFLKLHENQQQINPSTTTLFST